MMYKIKGGCLICNGDVIGNKKLKYFCKRCNLYYNEETLMREGLERKEIKKGQKANIK